jgi:hypothetical protein
MNAGVEPCACLPSTPRVSPNSRTSGVVRQPLGGVDDRSDLRLVVEHDRLETGQLVAERVALQHLARVLDRDLVERRPRLTRLQTPDELILRGVHAHQQRAARLQEQVDVSVDRRVVPRVTPDQVGVDQLAQVPPVGDDVVTGPGTVPQHRPLVLGQGVRDGRTTVDDADALGHIVVLLET